MSINWIGLVSELFAGMIGVLAVGGTVLLAIHNEPINPTLMVIDGAVVGSYFALKGANGTVAAVRTVVNRNGNGQ